MAFNMKPGKVPFLQTGRGIPSAFLQEKKPTQNAISGKKTQEELKAEARKIAQDKANAKLQKDIESKPLGGSTDVRTVTESADYVVPGQKPTKLVDPKDKKAYNAWLNASEENKAKFKDKKFTEQASATAAGTDKPQITTKPELTTTPPKNPVSGNPSRTIYTIEGTRGYAGEENKDKTGHRGMVTLNENRVNKEITFTENWNNRINKIYGQATEGSEAARGATGPQLEKRNQKAEERRKALIRETPTIKTTVADKKDAVNAASAMNRANWESNIERNEAEGINTVVFQKKSENKKASAKKSPVKQMKSKKKTPAKMKKY